MSKEIEAGCLVLIVRAYHNSEVGKTFTVIGKPSTLRLCAKEVWWEVDGTVLLPLRDPQSVVRGSIQLNYLCESMVIRIDDPDLENENDLAQETVKEGVVQ